MEKANQFFKRNSRKKNVLRHRFEFSCTIWIEWLSVVRRCMIYSHAKMDSQSEQIKRNEIGNRDSELNEIIGFIQLGNFDGMGNAILAHDSHLKFVTFRLKVRALISVNAANENSFIGIWRERERSCRISKSFSHRRRISNILIWKEVCQCLWTFVSMRTCHFCAVWRMWCATRYTDVRINFSRYDSIGSSTSAPRPTDGWLIPGADK